MLNNIFNLNFASKLSTYIRYVPHSARWQESTRNSQQEAGIRRILMDNAIETRFPPDWNDPSNYNHKIANIIQYETSANVHLPGTEEYKRRRVQNGTCSNIYPDMIVVPRSDDDISKIVQISTIVGVPISVTSEGRSYNLCKSVKSGKTFSKLYYFSLLSV